MRWAGAKAWVGAASIAALASVVGRWALADTESPLVIEWSAPDACPGRARVEARVADLLGGPAKPDAARLVARGVITKVDDKKYALALELDRSGHTSTRKLESSACETLTETGALVIALAFDPDAVQATSTRPPGSATPSASAPATASAPPVASSAAPLPSASVPPIASSAPPSIPSTVPWTPPPPPPEVAPKVRFGFGAGADFVGDYGSLPGFSPGFRVRVGLAIDAYSVEPLFEAWPSATATLARNAKVGADFALFAGGLRVCRRVLPWRSRATSIAWWTVCLDGEAGQISATGFGLDRAIAATAMWGAAGAELEGRLAPPGPIGVVAGVGFMVPFDPRPFVVETPARDEVFASAPISLRLSAGLDARF